MNPIAQKPSAATLAQLFEPIRDDLRAVERASGATQLLLTTDDALDLWAGAAGAVFVLQSAGIERHTLGSTGLTNVFPTIVGDVAYPYTMSGAPDGGG